MNDEKRQNTMASIGKKNIGARSAKECAYLAAFVALVIALQLALSLVPGVELVTVSFVAYAYVMGAKRGMIAATAFSLLRQLVFGFYATVLVLYLVYFNMLALGFGLLGDGKHIVKKQSKRLLLIVLLACVCTVFFHMFDNVLTPIWYGYSARATRAYFFASLPFMIPQVVCTAVSVTVLFLPLIKVFHMVKRTLPSVEKCKKMPLQENNLAKKE